MSEPRDRQGLEPDAAGASEGRKKQAIAAEDDVFDSGHGGDLELDAGLEGADVAGMDAKSFSGREIFDDEFTGEFEPGGALSAEVLEDEAVAAEDAGAEGLLESDADLDVGRGAEEAVAVNHVFVAGADLDGDDVSRKLGGEGDFAALAQGAVFGHEERAAAGDAFDGAEDSSTSAELGVGGELDGTGHPGKLARLGDDGFVGLEDELEDGHGGADDAALHEVSLE